jgi:KipI family sensor histidine kinase inhibitor
MRLLPCGDAALLVEFDGLEPVLAMYAALRDAPLTGVTDLVPAARTLLVRVDRSVTDLASVGRALRDTPVEGGGHGPGSLVEIEVIYDGEDLDDVARLTGRRTQDVIAQHAGQEWTVAFAGFSPGFGYLVPSETWPDVPRRENPRTKVAAGSVGLAGPYSGIYPQESPGGWQLIGRTDARLWDVAADPPALLRPGGLVRFVAAP